jgi:hypothetical protein
LRALEPPEDHRAHTDEARGSSTAGFSIPWGIVAVIVIATVVAAELMASIPARLAPAEALRYE